MNLQTFQQRLQALSAKVAQEGIILTEDQVRALENATQEKEAHGEIETEHPGYLGSQDTYYVGNLKGVGRIYLFEENGVPLLRILTDRGSEYCGNRESHDYALYLDLENI